MAKSINKVILLGHLGRDPDPHTTPGGRFVVNFTVATNRARRDAAGNQVEETEWFRVAVWDQLAQTAEQYLRKGAKIYLEGRLQTRRYVDRDNVERTAVEIVASDFVMLDRRPEDGDETRHAERQAPPPVRAVPPPFLRPVPPPPAHPAPLNAPTTPHGPPQHAVLPPPLLATSPAVSSAVPPAAPTAGPPPLLRANSPAPLDPAVTNGEDDAFYDIDDENAPF